MMKALPVDFRDLLEEFDRSGVEVVLVGGYAVAFHGRPPHRAQAERTRRESGVSDASSGRGKVARPSAARPSAQSAIAVRARRSEESTPRGKRVAWSPSARRAAFGSPLASEERAVARRALSSASASALTVAASLAWDGGVDSEALAAGRALELRGAAGTAAAAGGSLSGAPSVERPCDAEPAASGLGANAFRGDAAFSEDDVTPAASVRAASSREGASRLASRST
jgi:hypothetical protein